MLLSTIDDLNSGFAMNYNQVADSHKKLKAAFICVDFPNARAETSQNPSPSFYYDILARDGMKIFDTISYGKLNLEISLFNRWFTMPCDDAHYKMDREISAEIHRKYIYDCLQVSCDVVDYSQFDILYIAPVQGSMVPYSPTLVDKGDPIICKSGKVGLAVTFGADMYKRKGKLFAHENGHIMGLPDLYTYEITKGAQNEFSHCGTWDLMGLIEGLAPDFLAYSKWRLGWIDDAQVAVAEKSAEYSLEPVETSDGLKLVIVMLDSYHGYGVEYRKPLGIDTALPEDGLIVYRIDGTIASGRGCITIIPPEDEKYLKIAKNNTDGLLRKNDAVKRDGITIISLGDGRVKITR